MKQAFTLVELVVAISIISLVSVMSIGSFIHFFEQQNLQSQLQLFESHINSLDRKIKNKEIFDYKVELIKDTGYYVVKENTERNNNNLKLDLSNGTVSFENTDSSFGNTYTLFELDTSNSLLTEHQPRFTKTGNSSDFTITDSRYKSNYIFENGNYTENQVGTYTGKKLEQTNRILLKIYKNGKIIFSDFTSGPITIPNFSNRNNYQVQATLFTKDEITPLETIYLKQYSKTDKETNYKGNNVTIKNIFGNKEVSPDIVTELTFEQIGKQTTIKIP